MKTCSTCRWWGERPCILCRNRKSKEFLEEKRPDDSCDFWEGSNDNSNNRGDRDNDNYCGRGGDR